MLLALPSVQRPSIKPGDLWKCKVPWVNAPRDRPDEFLYYMLILETENPMRTWNKQIKFIAEDGKVYYTNRAEMDSRVLASIVVAG